VGRDLLNQGVCLYEKDQSVVREELIAEHAEGLTSGESYIIPCSGDIQDGRCSSRITCLDASHETQDLRGVELDNLGIPTGNQSQSYITCTIP
jgi:hypothetical protein